MGGVFKKAAKLTTKIAGLAGGDKLVGGVFDSTLGTDVLGEKAAQERARAAEAAKNQEMLNSQLNSNIIGNSGVNNIVQTEAGGSAANSIAGLDDNKRRRMGNISSTLGL